jgi:two-component system phosphate regulon sensor histidine kinase PhoR
MARKKRLLWQLYPSYLVITVVALVAVTWYASRSLKHFFLDQAASDLKARAHLLESQIHAHLDPLDEKGLDALCKRSGKRASTRITIILPSGKVVGDSEEDPSTMDSHMDRPEVLQALRGGYGVSTRYSRTLSKAMMYVGIPFKRNDQVAAVIRASIPVSDIDETIRNIQLKIAVGGLIIAVFAALISLLVSRKLTLPIEHIKKWAESIARGEFQFRPPVSDSEEIASLSDAMNQMAVELRKRIDTIVRQRNEIEAVFSSMVEGVIAVDTEERLISLNNAAAEMFGCKLSEAQGRSIQEVVRNTVLHRFLRKAQSSQKAVEEDIRLSSNGDRVLNVHGTVLRDAEGNRIGALVVLHDITRIQKLENIRREFVANVSHEIKTPITAIRGFVETLRNGAMKNSEDTKRFLGIIEKHVERLQAIIEDLLSLSRIEQETERGSIPLSDSNLREVLRTAIQVCDLKASAKKIGIELACDNDILVRTDPPLLEQAIVNLLDNAIKNSEAESNVWVAVTRTDGEIIVSVRDQGRGIAKEHIPRLFERFYRVDRSRSRQQGGTGLGLAIVKHITQAHRGHLTVESEPGKGSTFAIHLPRA